MNEQNISKGLLSLAVIVILYFIVSSGFFSKKPVFVLEKVDEGIAWETQKIVGRSTEEIQNFIIETEEKRRLTTDLGDEFGYTLTLAKQYEYLGEGKQAFQYLQEATILIPTKAVSYFNIGSILNQLGATTSAKNAYDLGLSVEPQLRQNHVLVLDFYTHVEGIPESEIDNAFNYSLETTNRFRTVLSEYAKWLETTGDKDMAIEIWEEILALNPENKEQIQQEIDSLRD